MKQGHSRWRKEDIIKMYYKGFITYNNKASNSFSDFKLIMTTPPEYIHSEIRHDTFVVPNRDGELYGENTYRGNTTIKVSFDIVTSGAVANYTAALNALYMWLEGTGQLSISDEAAYYEVKKVVITTDQRTIVNYGKIDVEFTVYPYKFKTMSPPYTDETSLTNTDYDTSMPMFLYTFADGVTSATISVNNKSMTIYKPTGSSIVFVDTRKQISYYQDNQDMNLYHNVRVAGDYRDLYFKRGNITITVSSGSVRTYPRWGWKI